jgi:hypothetical protein
LLIFLSGFFEHFEQLDRARCAFVVTKAWGAEGM